MKMILDFMPFHCPHCGKRLVWKDNLARSDFFAGCVHTCLECGVQYKYVKTKDIDAAALASGGDAERYW